MSHLLGPHFVAARILATNPADRAATGYVGRVRLQVRRADGQWASPVSFVLDTGASHSVINREFAEFLGIDLEDEPDDGFVGATGRDRSWFRPRYVRFADLDGFQFKVWFVIPEGVGPAEPLLGLRDIYLNFDVATTDERVFFLLKTAHTGEPCPAAAP